MFYKLICNYILKVIADFLRYEVILSELFFKIKDRTSVFN